MDLIDRSALLEQAVPHVRGSHGGYSAKVDDWAVLVRDIKAAPAVKAEPVVHAHWVKDPTMPDCYCGYYRCSRCQRIVPVSHGNSPEASYPYCNCGAKMDEGTNDEEI